jgi:hypothetical protein
VSAIKVSAFGTVPAITSDRIGLACVGKVREQLAADPAAIGCTHGSAAAGSSATPVTLAITLDARCQSLRVLC